METAVHVSLKAKSAAVLRHAFWGNCCAAATEVLCPIARFRVDVAGYADALPASGGRAGAGRAPRTLAGSGWPIPQRGDSARTVIIECKQSRADFLSDRADREQLLRERAHLERVRRALEERIIKVCEPELRVGGSALFSELEAWDFSQSRVASYRAITLELEALDKRLHGSSKFWTLAHYRLADALYIAAPTGMILASEVPEGWGLMEYERRRVCETDSPVDAWMITRQAPLLVGRASHRQRLLRNIAVALSRKQGAGPGLEVDEPEPIDG